MKWLKQPWLYQRKALAGCGWVGPEIAAGYANTVTHSHFLLSHGFVKLEIFWFHFVAHDFDKGWTIDKEKKCKYNSRHF